MVYLYVFGLFNLGLVVPWALDIHASVLPRWMLRYLLTPALTLVIVAITAYQIGATLAVSRWGARTARDRVGERRYQNPVLYHLGLAVALVGLGLFGWGIHTMGFGRFLQARYIETFEEHRLIIPIVRPGLNTMIDLNVDERTAVVSEYRTPFWERLSYLHRSPGPHNVAIRGNWFWTRAWRWVADATVYLVLFLPVSGLYLWALLRPERRVGLILLAAGPARLHREPPWQSESCQRRLDSEPSYSPEHSDQFLGCDEGAAHFQRDARQ